MVRPAQFGSNAETAGSNFFQRSAAELGDAALRAQQEFDALALALADAGVRVHQFAGQLGRALPDEVFPNNWLSLHADGTAVLYPLLAPNRRRERRRDILAALVDSCGYRLDHVVDLTHLEARGEYLEGTGSVVLDRARRVAYACLSPRTCELALAEFARAIALRDRTVHGRRCRRAADLSHERHALARQRASPPCARPRSRMPRSAAASLRAWSRPGARSSTSRWPSSRASPATCWSLRRDRARHCAVGRGPALARGARRAHAFERHGRLVSADIATIERIGGGSVRCMLAEVALPPARDGRSLSSQDQSERAR